MAESRGGSSVSEPRYTAYPKAEPTPVASSAPPASSLYSSPVVSLPFSSAPAAWTPFLWDGGGKRLCLSRDA